MSAPNSNESLEARLTRLDEIYHKNIDGRTGYFRDIKQVLANEFIPGMSLKLRSYPKDIRNIPSDDILSWLRRVIAYTGTPPISDKLKQLLVDEIEELIFFAKDGLAQREALIENKLREQRMKEDERVRQAEKDKEKAIRDNAKVQLKQQLQVASLVIDSYKEFMNKKQIGVAVIMFIIIILSIVLATTLHENLYVLMIILPLGYGIMHAYKYLNYVQNLDTKARLEKQLEMM